MWKDERNGLYGDYMRGRHLGGNPTRGNLAAIIAHAAEQATPSAEEAVDVADEEKKTPMPTTTIYLIRHGARHDYANPELWKQTCARLGHEPSDPPLSALGHKQAREVAAALSNESIDAILSSPYLRVIQTSQPLAHALGLPILIDNGLAEFKHHPSRIPPPGTRVNVFPEVDDLYEPILPTDQLVIDQKSGQEPVVEYLRRLILMAKELPKRYAGKSVACYSHAASVGLVAALTGEKDLLAKDLTFAPCGIWKLTSEDDGATWAIAQRGEENICSENDPSTFSWGFMHTRDPPAMQADWERALAAGPTTEL